MTVEDRSGEHIEVIQYHLKCLQNGELERENEYLKIKNRVNEIMNEGILVTEQREARKNFRHGKDTTRKGPKVHSPVRDPQLKETASTPSSDISDGIVEHGVDSDSMQLTRNHQTQDTSSLRSLDRPRKHDLKRNVFYEKNHPNGSYIENIDQYSQAEKSILNQHGSDSKGLLETSTFLTKTEPRESDDESPGVYETLTPKGLALYNKTCRRVKDDVSRARALLTIQRLEHHGS